ncbi:T9SS type A sorting domain-containing protein [Hymenobacter wooponensis]|uniref:T9SS type A sorting domain-containing protein n=1 Tax=Hymenobacter wooponensis TaxID=1525360 RepID=UPI001436B2C3|nr:T9SS type A sorting domain-containing protein [Hymenobacter wooponensis]
MSAAVNGTAVTSPICPGTNVTLTATGASSGATYTFRDASGTIVGQNATGTLQVTPTTSTTYTVTTNTPNCGNSTVTQVISISANELTASASPANITTGNSSTLTVNGGTGTYQWYANSGNGNVLIATTTDPSISVTPLATTQYTVRGTTATGNCADDAITRVILNGKTLPVTLTSFSASRQSSNVYAKWATANELNNAYFEVQRSTDSKSFTTIGKVAGNGTTATGASYSFTDKSPLAATSYYRLRQVDTDGTSSYSSVVAISSADKIEASFYPNPTNSQVTLPVVNGLVQYRIYNATGQNVATGQAAGGSTVDIQHVPMGVYFLELISAEKHNVQRFVKQ